MTEERHDDNSNPGGNEAPRSDSGVPNPDLRPGHGQLSETTTAARGESGTPPQGRNLEKEDASGTEESSPGSTEAGIAEVLAQILSVSTEQSQYWEGPLPSPQVLAQYDVETQRKIIAWNDAKILDESKRLDSIVEAEISHAKTVTGWGVLFTLVFTALAGVAGLGQGNLALAALFLGVPAMSIIATFINSARPSGRGKSR